VLLRSALPFQSESDGRTLEVLDVTDCASDFAQRKDGCNALLEFNDRSWLESVGSIDNFRALCYRNEIL
jgi:hypothetical protein